MDDFLDGLLDPPTPDEVAANAALAAEDALADEAALLDAALACVHRFIITDVADAEIWLTRVQTLLQDAIGKEVTIERCRELIKGALEFEEWYAEEHRWEASTEFPDDGGFKV